MPYDVEIKTINGLVKTEIKEITELENLLTQYYDTYLSVETKYIEPVKKKVKINENIKK